MSKFKFKFTQTNNENSFRICHIIKYVDKCDKYNVLFLGCFQCYLGIVLRIKIVIQYAIVKKTIVFSKQFVKVVQKRNLKNYNYVP